MRVLSTTASRPPSTFVEVSGAAALLELDAGALELDEVVLDVVVEVEFTPVTYVVPFLEYDTFRPSLAVASYQIGLV